VSTTAQRRWRSAHVVAVSAAADNVRRIGLQMPTPVHETLEGSHLDVGVLIDGRTETRSYSIVSGDSHDRRVVYLGVQRAAASRGGSRYMHSLSVGATLRVTQPLTSFPFRRPAGPLRFLAGGIGVTALVSMAQSAARIPSHPDYHFTYVGRRPSVMPFATELSQTHGEALTLHSTAQHGRFDIAGYVASCPPQTTLYVCGPIGMLEAVRTAWASQGRAPAQMRFETFGTAGKYPVSAFTVRVPKQELEVVVGEGQSMLEALEDAGAEVMYDCRKGECGLCQVDFSAVRGVVDHRDVFFSDQQHQTSKRLCTCVTRIAATADHPMPSVTLSLP
jgi:vanillate monooxygenase ferredoxin subunit